MCVAAETLEEPHHLFVHHRVVRDIIIEIRALARRWKFAIQQQITGFEKIAVLGQLLDRVTAIKQNTFIAIDIGDF